jgi:hypothetical protein
LSIKDNLEPKLSWLQARLQLDSNGLCSIIQLSPLLLLGMGIETNIEPTIKFYEDSVGSNYTISMIAKDPNV